MSAAAPALRRATPADVPALAAIYAEAARTLGPAVYTPAQVAAWQSFGADTPAFRAYVLDAETWVAEDAGGQVIGFCGVGGGTAVGEVHSLYVRPGHGRRGLGTRLLAHALAAAAARGVVRFEAWATPFSQPVFERAGFELVEVVRAPYQGVMFDRRRMARG